jgi:hypothetical protein
LRHEKVEYDQVGADFFLKLKSFVAVSGKAGDLKLILEQQLQTLQNNRVIVCKK